MGDVRDEVRDDLVPLEEPLAVVIDDGFGGVGVMPTGTADDLALVAGFLASEGVVEAADDVRAMAPCPTDANQVRVRLASGVRQPDARPVAMTSACGLCGTRSVEQVLRRMPPRPTATSLTAPTDARAGAAGRPRAPAPGAYYRSGVHAAALFAPELAHLVDLKEDVGRHNATGRLGRALLDGRWPLVDHTLWVFGRVAFEIVQKALVAGVSHVVGVGGPTSLAVELARSSGSASSRSRAATAPIATPGGSRPLGARGGGARQREMLTRRRNASRLGRCDAST
ncbi:MAG: formate dehydrogenase accessory sulfurtransferase FdhD [Myxococcota bacterium]